VICEAGISNIAFLRDGALIWPDGPHLAGITMQLLEPRLADAGLTTRHGQIRLADLPSVDGAFVTNSTGVAPVGRIDDVTLPVDSTVLKGIVEIYESVPWDAI
jgi:branched-subunit amino acid aminotransferase/4-amino-4-deoxychorismate lyase